jgi:hypothetical protein
LEIHELKLQNLNIRHLEEKYQDAHTKPEVAGDTGFDVDTE